MKDDEIARRLARAPRPFLAELEDLRRRGIIRPDWTVEPSVRRAISKAAKRLIEENKPFRIPLEKDSKKASLSGQIQATEPTTKKISL